MIPSDSDKTITSMCMTWRHDFGLTKKTDCSLSSGVSDIDRQFLLGQMKQIYNHHVAPLEEEIARLRALLDATTVGPGQE